MSWETFRKKPVSIRAFQLTEKVIDEAISIQNENQETVINNTKFKIGTYGKNLFITTLAGEMCARIGDWIIEGVEGEMYPCKPQIFEKTYERVFL